MEDLVELKAICELLRCECVKFFEEGNKTAGTRARKMLQQVKGKAQDLRVGIQETKRQMDMVKNDNTNNTNMNMNSMEGATTANVNSNGDVNINPHLGAMAAPEMQQPQQQQYAAGMVGGVGGVGEGQQEFESNDGNNIPVGLSNMN